MQCGACGTANRAGVKFCEECGTRLDVTCPACGASVPSDKKFCGDCGARLAEPSARAAGAGPTAGERFASPQAYTPAHLAERILKDRSALAGERKQVTVLFADVSGFTALSERIDPEDVHGIINAAFELMLAEVHRYEGTVNQFLGDGLMALFGAPLAYEDHPRRAALAALGMQAALARYRDELHRTRGIDFRVRMGLNTGLVVVGAIGDNLRMDYTAVGDTTNLAARMQALAEPGQIVVAAATERLIAPYVELRPLGTVTVKNRQESVAAFEVVRARPAVSPFAARVARGLSPFVGRDDALATLDRALAAARSGRGQAVFIMGDAGIGKSRLLLEFRARCRSSVTWVEGACVSFGAATPFLPIIDMLKMNFGIGDRDGDADIIAKIEQGVEFLEAEKSAAAPYLRYLLAVDPGDGSVAAMDPTQRRAHIVAALQRVTALGSRRRPVVLVVEDAHWIDSASEDFLKSLTASLPGMRVLLVITYRPLYVPPLGDRTYYWRISLQPVAEDDAERIVRASLGVDDVPRDLCAIVAAKAEGNPFFLEEIGRTLVATGAVRVEGGRLVAGDSATVTVPDTVQDVIAARIDRLAEAQKRTVQTASVIGREFALGLLRRVSDVQSQLEQSLTELQRIELIYEKAAFGDREYVFRHALTQDVAYESLLQSERRRLHSLIGAALEDAHAGRLEERAEELVHHFTRGEQWSKVVRYAREAAERAASLCVDDRAVEFYRTALAALRRIPATVETARAGIDIRLAMRAPLWRGGQPEELYGILKEAEELATRHEVTDRLDTIYAFLVQYYWAKGDQQRAFEYADACLARAAAKDDVGLRVTGLLYLAHALVATGRYAEGLQRSQEIMSLLEGPRATQRFGLSGLPYCGACVDAAECLTELGDEAGALDFIERGQHVADSAQHLYSQMLLAQARGHILGAAGRADEAIGILEAAAATCREKNFVGQLINALRHLGHAYVVAGRPSEALAAAQEAIDLQEKASVSVARTIKLTIVADAHLALGDLDEAGAALERALDYAERQQERGYEGWARLSLAALCARRGDRAAAVEAADAAEDIAEELGMRPLLERCRGVLKRLG
ncbi:MAG TPA: adenylate/guanylate cyclase domain-containing protein [Methylomirabilota bacterium]|jgi:class 3 adenylate cyclase/tetratricopeptide (TPR) repeat protein